MKFCLIKTDDPKYEKEKLLRWEVLNKPLGLPPGSEVFSEEEKSLHLVAIEKRKVVGCVLFHYETNDYGRLYQLAISQEYRGHGFGRQMVAALEKELVKRGVKEVYLQAREETIGFYTRLGFRPHVEQNALSSFPRLCNFFEALFRESASHPGFNFEGRVKLTLPSNPGWEVPPRNPAVKKVAKSSFQILTKRLVA